MANIVSISILKMYESCERTSFYVQLTSDEGFTMTAAGHQTGSVYTNGEGLSIEVARDRALIDAATWADFLQLEVEPFTDDNGNVVKPSMTLGQYRRRRKMAVQAAEAA